MSVKTRKISLLAVGETPSDRTNNYNYLKNIASTLATLGNEVIRLHVCNQYRLDELSKNKTITKGEALKIITGELGTSIQNSGYQLSCKYPNISSEIRSCFTQNIFKTIQNNFYDILMGKMSIPSYRKTNINIPFSAKKNEDGGTNKIYIENGRYMFNFPLTHSEKKLNNIKFYLNFGRDRSGNKIIVDRIISGEYKLCNSSIQVVDNDFIMLISYEQPDTVAVNTMVNVMGVDIGINRPISFYIDGVKHQPRQIMIGEKIQHERMKFHKHRRSLQQSMKFSKGGHGRKRKTQSENKLKEKEKNWAQLMNHKMSRELINIAKDNNVGTIKMEDLTGITTNTKDYFLKSWAYFQLQTDIEYKSKEIGINILWVDPKNTSNTCPTCEISNPLNRNDKDKTIFKCVNEECIDFDLTKDSDIVASYNICYKEGSPIKGKSKKGKMETAKKKKELLQELI